MTALSLGQIIKGDCLEVLRTLPDASVDFVLTDPPYNVGKDYGENGDKLSDSDYLLWLDICLERAGAVAKFPDQVGFYIPKKYTLQIWNEWPLHRQVMFSWGPEGAIRGGYVHQHYSVLLPPNPPNYMKDAYHNVQHRGMGFFCREDKTGHPGQTSLEATEIILKGCTNPGDIVLDPFMGSGTTAIACEKLGRQWIGIEQEQHWIDLAWDRIAAHREGRTLAEWQGHQDVGQRELFQPETPEVG